MKNSNKKVFFISILLVLCSILGFMLYNRWKIQKRYTLWLEKRKKILRDLKNDILEEAGRFNQRYALLIHDLRTGYKLGLNEEMLFPSASLVKVPIMACVYCADKEGVIRLNQKIILKNTHKASGSGGLKNLPEGTTLEVEELVRKMISKSDNTVTNILIDLLGFDYLNDCFKRLGLKNTNIYRKMLDDKARSKGLDNFTNALDTDYILEKIYRRELIDKNVSEKCLDFLKQQKVRDRIPAMLPSDTIVANKTGLENGVCHDAGIIFTKEGDFLICVLTSHNFKTAQPPKQFISRIAQRLYLAFNKDE
ncbi:MAG: class A beta-lactamase-related serine hydrolase [Candidatus Omnitrophica bacterium]|nr:class A beta-lactamase-related serine hydrolase [Candidatus Omnitrophota bacterium]